LIGRQLTAPANVADPFGQQPAAEPAPAAAPAAKPDGAVVEKPKYLLFRFLDFNVEPTKHYRYRVKLIIANPNYKLDQSHLETPELAQGETRETEWSKPSDPVFVPVLEHYFAGEGKSVGGDQEPETTFGVAMDARPPPRLLRAYNKRAGIVVEPTVTWSPGERLDDDGHAEDNVLLADFSWNATLG
jgi:hypothetical protein